MNEDPEVQEFLLGIGGKTFKFKVQFAQPENFSCKNCAIHTYCKQYTSSAALNFLETEWIPEEFTICDKSRTYSRLNSVIICEYEMEEIPRSNNYIVYSPGDFDLKEVKGQLKHLQLQGPDKSKFLVTASKIINNFCESGFCPIRKPDMTCIKTIECPFKNLFEETKVEILYLPKK